jgi:hypothetical protein
MAGHNHLGEEVGHAGVIGRLAVGAVPGEGAGRIAQKWRYGFW